MSLGVLVYSEMGQPVDVGSARRLAELDRFQFQQWALNLIDAVPMKTGAGKGPDRGVDGHPPEDSRASQKRGREAGRSGNPSRRRGQSEGGRGHSYHA